MKVEKSGWKWMKVDEIGWMWMKLDDIGCFLDEIGWKWMKVDESGWKWMEVDESGWTWMKVDENGWNGRKWLQVDESGCNFFICICINKFNLGVRREPSSLLFANNFHTCADLAEKLPHQLPSLSALNEPLGAHPPQKQSVGHFSLMTFIRRSCSSLAILRARARFR